MHQLQKNLFQEKINQRFNGDLKNFFLKDDAKYIVELAKKKIWLNLISYASQSYFLIKEIKN